MVWIALAAFKTQIALLRGDVLFTPVSANFHELLFSRSSDYLADFRNSLIVASVSTALVVFVSRRSPRTRCIACGWPRWVPVAVLGWSLVFHMIPPITMVGPWYVMFRGLGLDNTYTGSGPRAPRAQPADRHLADVGVRARDPARAGGGGARRRLHDAADAVAHRVSAGRARGSPRPAILVFVFSWNEFAVALNLTAKQTATVPVAIARFAQEYEIKHGVMAAGAVLSAIPAVLLLLVAQRHIVKGLTAGAIR